MKRIILLIFILFPLLPLSSATASWLIDVNRFSASVHRDISCQICHDYIASDKLHPDPGKVTRPLSDFFIADSCLGCHDTVEEGLAEGTHGAIKVADPGEYANCIACHDPHYALPKGQNSAGTGAAGDDFLSEEDRSCMRCHGLSPDDDAEEVATFCFQCHARTGTPAQAVTARMVPLINPDEYQGVPHALIACFACHPQAAAYNHDRQERPDCLQCHVRHDAKVAGDVHLAVNCQACHSKGVEVQRDPQTATVYAKVQPEPGTTLEVHQMDRRLAGNSCNRCHQPGNRVGAAAMVLPPKGMLCMPCHASTFSAGGTVAFVALLIFSGGMITIFAVVLTGSIPGLKTAGTFRKAIELLKRAAMALFSRKILIILRALLLDVLLQRRLYRKSAGRWLIHSLIFLSFAFRFFWGLAALFFSLWGPQWSWIWFMLDKNNPVTAFLFDLSGILILAGVTTAIIRGARAKRGQPSDLPPQDRVALSLIAGMVLVGFALEAVRIAMTGSPPGAGYAFAGYGLSRLFAGAGGLTGVYAYIWYLHAVITGAFIAYLPFSRLLHIILAPVVLAMSAVSEEERKEDL